MRLFNKLRPETSINMLLPAIVTLVGLILLWTLFDRTVAWGFVALVVFLYSLFSFTAFLRTRNTGYLIAALFQFSCCIWIGGAREGILHLNAELVSIGRIGALLFGVWMQILLLSRRFKWRGREIMELAAHPVERISNGFTERPRPLGKTPITRDEAVEFARFAAKNLVAMPYVESDRIVLVPVSMAQSFRYLYPWNRGYNNATWVSFGTEGRISVNIARQDYLKYKESLSFDHLCESLGRLFVEFIELHRRGEEARIIDRMNALRINPYT